MRYSLQYRRAFLQRTAQARQKAGKTQRDMASLMQISQGLYKQYEVRSPLPHHLVRTFCELTGVTLDWLFTGKHFRRDDDR